MRRPSNVVLGAALAVGVSAMFAFAYVNVPLFKLVCARLGIGGKAAVLGGEPPVMSSTTGPIEGRDITVTFMGVSASGLPVRFGPTIPSATTRPGLPVRLSYVFTNLSGDSVFFRAVHSIVPEKAAREFQLIQCFCFDDQALGPRETRAMPVYFALSPRMPPGIEELALSYTLFPRDPKKPMPVPAKDAN